MPARRRVQANIECPFLKIGIFLQETAAGTRITLPKPLRTSNPETRISCDATIWFARPTKKRQDHWHLKHPHPNPNQDKFILNYNMLNALEL